VASELDDSSERIITDLADEYGFAINAAFFRVFRDGDRGTPQERGSLGLDPETWSSVSESFLG
jgi:hypothetical protein